MSLDSLMPRALLLVVFLSVQARAEGVPSQTWHRVVGLLEYLEGDYGNALKSGDQAELEEQRGLADEAVKQLVAAGTSGAPYLERAREVNAAIVAARPESEVKKLC